MITTFSPRERFQDLRMHVSMVIEYIYQNSELLLKILIINDKSKEQGIVARK